MEDAPGFKKVLLRPQPDKRLTHAAATYDSPSGTFEVAWDYEADGTLDYTFAIPFDTEAAVVLQNAHIDRMYINGSPDNRTMQQDAETVRFTLSAGCYTIRASPIETESPH